MLYVVSVTLSNITQLVLSHNKLTGKLLSPRQILKLSDSSEMCLWRHDIAFNPGKELCQMCSKNTSKQECQTQVVDLIHSNEHLYDSTYQNFCFIILNHPTETCADLLIILFKDSVLSRKCNLQKVEERSALNSLIGATKYLSYSCQLYLAD